MSRNPAASESVATPLPMVTLSITLPAWMARSAVTWFDGAFQVNEVYDPKEVRWGVNKRVSEDVIAAVLLLHRSHGPVLVWQDRADQHIRWGVSASSSVAVAHAAFDAAVANYPEHGNLTGDD